MCQSRMQFDQSMPMRFSEWQARDLSFCDRIGCKALPEWLVIYREHATGYPDRERMCNECLVGRLVHWPQAILRIEHI